MFTKVLLLELFAFEKFDTFSEIFEKYCSKDIKIGSTYFTKTTSPYYFIDSMGQTIYIIVTRKSPMCF
mgnify:CR=1 FL=1